MFRKHKKHKSKCKRFLQTTIPTIPSTSKKKKGKVMGMTLSEVRDICETIPLQTNIEVLEF